MRRQLRKRRRLLIDRLQHRLLLFAALYMAGVAVIFLLVIFLPPALELRDPALSVARRRDVATELIGIHRRLWPALAVAASAVLLHVLLTSHRIAGPLYRIRTVLAAVTRGDLSVHTGIRAHDYLTNEARVLTETVDSLRRQVEVLREHRDRLTASVAMTGEGLQSCSVAKSWVHFRQARTDLARLSAAIDWFDLEGESQPAEPLAVGAGPPSSQRQSADAAGTGGAENDTESDEERPTPLRAAGFSLIEVLLVVGVISTIAAIAVPAYMEVYDRARVAKGIGDVDAISTDIVAWRASNSAYPDTLVPVGYSDSGYIDPYGEPYVYYNVDKNGVGGARKDQFLKPLNSDFDVYSIGMDGKSTRPIQAPRSQDDIIRAANGGFINLASEY